MEIWILLLVILAFGLFFAVRYWLPKSPLNRYEQMHLMKAILDHSLSCIYVKDLNLKYILVNRHALEVFGFKEHEVIGKTDEELFPAPYAIASKASDLKVIKEGNTIKEELVANLSIDDRDFLTIKTPLKNKNGTYALCGIAMDITQQKSAQRQLNSYLERLEDVTTELMDARIVSEQVNRSQNAFLAAMSHELRTPLNGIIGNSSLLLNTDIQENQQKYLDRILHSSQVLMGIIEQVLDFSKIAAGNVKLDLTRCDLIELIKECYEILIVKAEEKQLELNLELPLTKLPEIIADKLRLKQIIINLVGNSIKFTNEGSVTVKLELLAASSSKILVQLDILDTGIGISPDELDHLFERFWQGKPSQKGGTGLGLAITKELVSMMNGGIAVESKLEEGTVFTLKIPFETYHEAMYEKDHAAIS